MTQPDVPRAVATGSTGATAEPGDRVAPRRAALIAGVLVALFAFAMYGGRDVPGFALRLVGAPTGGVARYGGVIGHWQPYAHDHHDETVEPDDPRGVRVYKDDDGRIMVEMPGVAEADAHDTIQNLSGNGLEFHVVVESEAAAALIDLGVASDANAHAADDSHAPPRLPVEVDDDRWTNDDGGRHTDFYLRAHTREALAAALAEAKRRGWSPPAGAIVGYQQIVPDERARDQRPSWRTYFLAAEVPIDGTSIMDATGNYDPNTNRPIVLVEFDRAGAEKFGDLTARITGHKLAFMLGDEVKSAPVIETAIRGGRASITMGSHGSPRDQEHERDVTVQVLRAGRHLAGGTFVDARWVPATASRELAGRCALAAIAGLLAFALALALVRFARPERRRDLLPDAPATTHLWKRVLWTLLACAVYAFGTTLALPGINEAEYAHIAVRGFGAHRGTYDPSVISVFALGVIPLISAFIAVEVVASIVPRWRKLRDGVRGRRKLGLATAIVAVALAGVQAYFVATYFKQVDYTGELYDASRFWLTVLSLVSGTLVLAVLASLISTRGLGNGYAVLMAFGWLWHPDWETVAFGTSASEALLAAAVIALVGALTIGVTGWRVRAPGRAPVPLPIAGKVPLHEGGGAVALVGVVAALGVRELPEWVFSAQLKLQLSHVVGAIALIVATLVWGFAFARPGRRRAELAAAGLQPASWESWLRAVVLSLGAIGAVFAVTLLESPADWLAALCRPIAIMVAAATAADLVAEWRGRKRGANVAVWPLHDPTLAEVARARLTEAGIPHVIQAQRLRQLFVLFGAFAPMMVLVPEAHAKAAHELLRDWLEPVPATAPATA